jgi:hypothetical protein
MPFLQSSIELAAETTHSLWQHIHLMLFNISNTLATIFKHAYTKCFHNRAHNLSPSVETSEDIRSDECPAYTEVVRLA